MIGVQSGHLWQRVHTGIHRSGSRGWDARRGDICEDPPCLFIHGKPITAICREPKLWRKVVRKVSARSLTIANDLDRFEFDATPINQTLVTDLAGGCFIKQQRNVVLVGGIGTARPPDPSLRHRLNRQRKLALQMPSLTPASRSLATALLGCALARLAPAVPKAPLLNAAPWAFFNTD